MPLLYRSVTRRIAFCNEVFCCKPLRCPLGHKLKSRNFGALYWTLGVLIAPCIIAAEVYADVPTKHASYTPFMSITVITLLIVQTLLIMGLQRSRLNNKRAKKTLREAQKALEQRIQERTDSLNKINQLLMDEVSRHEATGHQLRETKEYLQSMINSMPSIIIGVTAKGIVTHWNASAEHTFEIFSQDALGQPIESLLSHLPISLSMIRATIQAGDPHSLQYSNQHDNNSRTYFDITIYPLISLNQQGAVIRIDDVTRRVTIENLMIQNEKMFSLGEVATGIAHEINNPLSVILQNTQNIFRRIDKGFPNNQHIADELGIKLEQMDSYLKNRDIYTFLNAIRDAGERSATIVNTMLEFSHSNHRNTEIVDINRMINQTININNTIYNTPNIVVKPRILLELGNNIPPIKCCSSELQQVLLNLLRNATQALTSQPGSIEPCIIIRTYIMLNNLVIEVQDNGPGMSDNVKNHIFEPFFTTKSTGSGTGLGLSISYFIITERHGGSIEVKSNLGKGTTFIIQLPYIQTTHTNNTYKQQFQPQ